MSDDMVNGLSLIASLLQDFINQTKFFAREI